MSRWALWAIRVAGVVFIVSTCFGGPGSRVAGLSDGRLLAACALAFMWLFALGSFGFGRLRRADVSLLLPTAVALLIRTFLVLHSNSEITTYFPEESFSGGGPFTDKHSIVYGGLKALLLSTTGASHDAFMNLNGVVGALAALAAGLFVSRRFASPEAGFFAALLFAVHPLLARYAPTDAQVSILLFWWLAGLALLASEELGSGEIVAGFWAVGIAGAMRVEGIAYVVLALLFVRWRAVVKHRLALAVGAAGAVLSSLGNFALVFPAWTPELSGYSGVKIRDWFVVAGASDQFMAMASTLYGNARNSDLVFVVLFWAGGVAAVLSRRFRLAGMFAAASIVALVVAQVNPCNAITMHRMNVTVAIQALVAGIGAAWLLTLATRPSHRRLAAVALTLAAGTIPIRNRDAMRRAYTFNVEYSLLHDHWPVGRSGCRLLYFNSGDADLDYPGNIVPKSDPINCAAEDCLAQVRPGGCYYLLRGSGCTSRETGKACDELMSGLTTRPVAETWVDFNETFQSATRGAAQGTVGLYEVSAR